MGDSTTITVDTSQGPVVIRKMPLGDYGEVFRAFEKMPQHFKKITSGLTDDKLKDTKNSEFIAMLPIFLAESWDDVIHVVAVPTDKDAEFLGKVDPADGLDIVAAIVELNDIPRIIDAVKRMAALRSKLARPQKQK